MIETDKPDHKEIKKNLEEVFKEFLPDENAPEHLKKEVFQTLDTLNLIGDFNETRGSHIVLTGELRVVDGQQRLRALVDSRVKNYNFPIQVHYNLSPEEEVDLFRQLNLKATKLSFGELAKSARGPLADVIQSVVNDKRYPMKISLRGTRGGVNASLYCIFLYWAYHNVIKGGNLVNPRAGKSLLRFLDSEMERKDVQMTAVIVRKLLQSFVDIHGEWDSQSLFYRRTYLLAWAKLVMDRFMDEQGNINFRGFKGKLGAPENFASNSYIKEVVTGSDKMYPMAYNAIAKMLNKGKLQNSRIPLMEI